MRDDATYYFNLEQNLQRQITDEDIETLMREKGLKRICTTGLVTNEDSMSVVEHTLQNILNQRWDERYIIKDTPKHIRVTLFTWLQGYKLGQY